MISEDLEHESFANQWAIVTDDLVTTGRIRPHQIQVRKGSPEGVLRNLEEFRTNGPRGEKTVYLSS